MKRYRDYMDGVKASEALHSRLTGLTAPERRTAGWGRYGLAAAALALVLGLGGWTAVQAGWTGGHDVPSLDEIGQPEPGIAPAGPGEQVGPDHIRGGYEVNDGETVTYYMLPGIRYGTVSAQEPVLDWAPPADVERRELEREELAALLGGETVLEEHLGWWDYDLAGYVLEKPDGTLWMLTVFGSRGESGLEHFELNVRPGGLPPTCIVYPESEVNEVFGTEITADGHDADGAYARRVSFVADGLGFRFGVTGQDQDRTEVLVSRLVRYAIQEGLELS